MIKTIKESKRDLFDPNLSKEELTTKLTELKPKEIINRLESLIDLINSMYIDSGEPLNHGSFFFDLGVVMNKLNFIKENQKDYMEAFFEGIESV